MNKQAFDLVIKQASQKLSHQRSKEASLAKWLAARSLGGGAAALGGGSLLAANHVMSPPNSIYTLGVKNPRLASALMGGVVGSGIGLLSDPGYDRHGERRSRLSRAATHGAAGALGTVGAHALSAGLVSKAGPADKLRLIYNLS